jgi:hypothetical protein
MVGNNISRWVVIAAVMLTVSQLARMLYLFPQLAMIKIEKDVTTRRVSDREIKIKRDHVS